MAVTTAESCVRALKRHKGHVALVQPSQDRSINPGEANAKYRWLISCHILFCSIDF